MDAQHPLVTQPPTLNAYRIALRLLRAQLSWDLRPLAWRSRARLRAMRNRHAGAKAVILCNGPSLLKSDLDLLSGTFTFGLNKVNLLFDSSAFRPSCIVAVNPLVLRQNADFFRQTDIPLFLDRSACGLVGARPEVTFLSSVESRQFARDCSWGVYQGHTVTFVAMQLAFHLGFRDVALIGCDHYFSAQGASNQAVESGAVDVDHFSPDYFAGGVQWNLPDLFESEVAYTMARQVFEAHDRRIVNATEGGKLEIYPRTTLEAFLTDRREGAR